MEGWVRELGLWEPLAQRRLLKSRRKWLVIGPGPVASQREQVTPKEGAVGPWELRRPGQVEPEV